MREVFVDTAHLIAVLNKADNLHVRAMAVAKTLGPVRLVTTQAVLTEFLNFFAEWGPELRKLAARFVDTFSANPNVEVLPFTKLDFDEAAHRYETRADKGFSLTDCHSMIVMERRGIAEVLTSDHHFKQAGFKPLLAD